MFKEPLHIIHLTSALIWRGAEQQIVWLYEGLSKTGVTQTIFCRRQSRLETYCKEHQIQHVAYKRESGINWGLVQSLNRFCRSDIPFLFHIHDPHTQNAYLIYSLIYKKYPAVLHRRVDFTTADHFFNRLKYNYSGIKKIICVSEDIRTILQPSIKNPSCLEVVYPCVKLEDYKLTRQINKLYEIAPRSKGKYVIGNFAALVDHKDLPTFIRTAQYLLEVLHVPDLHFIIAGDGVLKDVLQQMIMDHHLENDVTMIGFREDINELLPCLDTYVFTSKMEGFGSTLLQVMAAEIPIVATKTGGAAEIFEPGIHALLCEPGDFISLAKHIQALKEDHEMRQKLTSNCSILVKAYNIDNYSAKILAIYSEAIKS